MLNHALLGVAAGGGYQMENSLLFRGAQYLTRTPASGGAIKSATFNVWLRLSDIAATQCLFFAGTDADNRDYAYFEGGPAGYTLTWLCLSAGVLQWVWRGAAKFRDPTGFVMLTFVRDLDNVSASGRLRVYLNGQLLTADSGTTVYPATTASRWWGAATPHVVGFHTPNSLWYFRGILSEPVFVDGAALSPDVFGQIDPVTGSWRPKRVSGVDFGTNGFYLGRPWNSANLGNDASGRGNHWTPVGFAASDVVGDSPTNVFATLNPIKGSLAASSVYSSGNLVFTSTWPSTFACGTTAIPATGKWWFRYIFGNDIPDDFPRPWIGVVSAFGLRIVDADVVGPTPNSVPGSVCMGGTYTTGPRIYSSSAVVYSEVIAMRKGDTWDILIDRDANTVVFMINGIQFGPVVNGGMAAGELLPFIGCCTGMWNGSGFNQGPTMTATVDFGASGTQPPVAGFKALCTANLPATTGQTSGTFTGNANADGPCVFTGAVPETLSVNGNAVIWGTHADKLATGFKIRTASAAYNAGGANSWAVAYDKKPTVGPKTRAPANAQGN